MLSPKKRSCGKGCERAKKLDDFDLNVLRTVVHGFIQGREIPTIAKVVQHFDEDDMLPSVSTLMMQRMLKKHGFQYKKRCRNTCSLRRRTLYSVAADTCTR